MELDIDVMGRYPDRDRAAAAFHDELARQSRLAFALGGPRQEQLGTKKVFIDNVETIFDLAESIQRAVGAAGPDARIRRLRIFAHSGENFLAISPLQVNYSTEPLKMPKTSYDQARSIQLVGTPETGGLLNEGALVKLKGLFSGGGWAELHACRIAGGSGRALVGELARLWGTQVEASREKQIVGGGLEGDIVVGHPDGSVTDRPGKTPAPGDSASGLGERGFAGAPTPPQPGLVDDGLTDLGDFSESTWPSALEPEGDRATEFGVRDLESTGVPQPFGGSLDGATDFADFGSVGVPPPSPAGSGDDGLTDLADYGSAGMPPPGVLGPDGRLDDAPPPAMLGPDGWLDDAGDAGPEGVPPPAMLGPGGWLDDAGDVGPAGVPPPVGFGPDDGGGDDADASESQGVPPWPAPGPPDDFGRRGRS